MSTTYTPLAVTLGKKSGRKGANGFGEKNGPALVNEGVCSVDPSVEQAAEWSCRWGGGPGCGCALLGVWCVVKQALCVDWKGFYVC